MTERQGSNIRCDKCGGRCRAGSTLKSFTRYYCLKCRASKKVPRPGHTNIV